MATSKAAAAGTDNKEAAKVPTVKGPAASKGKADPELIPEAEEAGPPLEDDMVSSEDGLNLEEEEGAGILAPPPGSGSRHFPITGSRSYLSPALSPAPAS